MNIRPLPVAQLDASFAEKFWARTITRDSGCVEWTGPVAAQNRAMVFIAGAQYYASRVAFFLSTGTDPGADLVCHRCDNSLCIRRDHLFLGSQADNMADMRAKGRERHRHLAGEAHPNAKGSNDDIRAVRELYATGEFTQSQLAEQFGVSQKTIGNWARGAGRGDADGPTLAVGRGRRHPSKQRRICSVDGCTQPERAKGLCPHHYHRAWKAARELVEVNADAQESLL